MDKFKAPSPFAAVASAAPRLDELIAAPVEPKGAFAALCAEQGERAGSTEVEPEESLDEHDEGEPDDDDDDEGEPIVTEPDVTRIRGNLSKINTEYMRGVRSFEDIYAEVKANPRAHKIKYGDFDSGHDYKCEIEDVAAKIHAAELEDAIRDLLGADGDIARCPSCKRGDLKLDRDDETGALRGTCLAGCKPERVLSGLESLSLMKVDRERTAAWSLEVDALKPTSAPARSLEWLIPGLVPERALTLWIAPTESMKTWLLLHAALCVAAGIPFCGRPTIRKRVMLCLLEAAEINGARIEPLARGLGIDLEALVDGGWLYVRTREHGDLRTDAPETTKKLVAQIFNLKIELLAIDNYKMIRTPGAAFAANSEDVAAAAIAPLEELAHDGMMHGVVAGLCAVVLLVHGDHGKPRGSGAPPEHADWVLQIDKPKHDPESPVKVDVADGCRVAHRDAKLAVRYRGFMPEPIVPELVAEKGKPAETPPAEPDPDDLTARQVLIRTIVRDKPGIGLNAVCEALHERTSKNPSKRDVRADLAKLVELEEIRVDDAKKYWPSED
ncbi:MAG TPA: AAA family ATPase [Kofleriaceae bacterium]|jgi:hypothetical protein